MSSSPVLGKKRTLLSMARELPATNYDGAANSCSESDEDSPIPIVRKGLQDRGMNTPLMNRNMDEGSRTPMNKLEASVGRGGKMVYQVSRSGGPANYYVVQWRKPQQKKHKTWDGDAYLRIEGSKITMLNEDGGHMATSALIGTLPVSGVEMRVGQMDIEVDREISSDEFKASTCILNKPTARAVPAAYTPQTFVKPFKRPQQTHTPRPAGGYIPARPESPLAGPSNQPAVGYTRTRDESLAPSTYKAVAASSFYAPKKADKIVLGEKSAKQRQEWGGAIHDPKVEGAVVMQRPPDKQAKSRNTEIVDVVLDPLLTARMRTHQKEGVKFMYSCVMGLTGAEAQGCILADEMGLGKTLQTIALIYTLLKQSPFANESSVIGKALVVCPVTLVENWKKEFKKWVRPDQLSVVAADGSDDKIRAFTHHRGQHVLIIGYERLRKVVKQLASCQPPIDLIVCDEGHRLKSKDNKTTKMFEQLRTRRRIILSGTPVQNDLGEYWSMVDFTCPGLLGKYAAFAKQYEKPILKSRSVGCSAEQLETGRMRAQELADLSKEFVLRRTADVLDNYLPPKHEYVVFVAPTTLQLDVFQQILDPAVVAQYVRGSGQQPLALIDLMRKICNSPMLLRIKKGDDDDGGKSDVPITALDAALQAIPRETNNKDVTASGKMFALDRMLHNLSTTTTEKIVIVSNWTSTLNLIQELCKLKRYPFLRLDGQTAQKQRQEYVDIFNRGSRSDSFVFLLSAKAGGTGLNLIGASRLILFDSDWNPSTDLQAMARIHRDGQKRPVYIYRFLTTNTIDEKIYQRQITKTGLSDQMLDHTKARGDSKDSFTSAELRDIFTLNLRTDGCQTHDLLGCGCTKGKQDDDIDLIAPLGEDDDDEGNQPKFVNASQYDPEPTPKMRRKTAEEQKQKLAALKAWTHIDGFARESFRSLSDTILYNIMWDDWDKNGPIDSSSPIKGGRKEITPETDDEEEVVKPTKKRKSATISDLFMSDEENGSDDEAFSSAQKQPSVGPASYPSPESRSRSSSIQARNGKNKVQPKRDVDVSISKQHNLREVADRGQGGRIMFVFEKNSESKLDVEEDVEAL